MKATLALFLLFPIVLPAEEPTGPEQWIDRPIPQLVLADGKEFHSVVITAIHADAIEIRHGSGLARVPMESLKSEARAALGYDPEAAKLARARFEAEKSADLAAARARGDAARAAQQARRAAQMADEKQKAARAAKLAASTQGRFKVLSIVPDTGLLVRDYYPGSSGGVASAVAQIFGRSRYIAPRTGNTVYLLRNYEGPALADDDTFAARTVATNEIFQYTSSFGALTTVKVIEVVR